MKRALAITQCFPCGSWLSIEKILGALSERNYKIRVLGLGNIQAKNNKFDYKTIPYPAFNKYGALTCKSPVLNLLWNVPLIVGGLTLMLFTRPKLVAYNGLVTGLILSPFAKLAGIKSIVMYHSILGTNKSRVLTYVLKSLGKFPDMVVVNSRGSAEDIGWFIPKDKIIINEHFAEDIFFMKTKRDENHDPIFHISYAGRIDKDKRCFPLIEAAKIISKNPENNIIFEFAGAGSDIKKIEDAAKKNNNIKYVGYINDRAKLKEFYEASDVVWSFADKTYLALPAVEALACGKPIIIPKYAAIAGSSELVDESLVPKDVGWLVDTDNIRNLVAFIKKLAVTKEYLNMEKSCVKLAETKYSKRNVAVVTNKIDALVSKDA